VGYETIKCLTDVLFWCRKKIALLFNAIRSLVLKRDRFGVSKINLRAAVSPARRTVSFVFVFKFTLRLVNEHILFGKRSTLLKAPGPVVKIIGDIRKSGINGHLAHFINRMDTAKMERDRLEFFFGVAVRAHPIIFNNELL